MQTNMGTLDRVVRGVLVAPVALIVASVVGIGTLGGIVLAIVAVIMGVTALVGFCPLYRLIGLSTDRRTASSS